MLPNLNEIKLRRKQLGLTQSGLAEKCGVSQSLITKIESGKLVPSYENAKRVLDTLESMHSEAGVKAKDIMTRKIVGVKPDATIKHAVYMMKKYSVSQLPVIDMGKTIGTVSEKGMLGKMQSKEGLANPAEMQVSDVMGEPLPTIMANAPASVLSTILAHYPAVLVVRGGKIAGIIAKSDLLHAMLLKGRK